MVNSRGHNRSDLLYDIPTNAPIALEMMPSGMQPIKRYFVGFRMRAGIMCISSCRAAKRNQREKQSSGARLNPPVQTKDLSVQEISAEQETQRVNGLNTENYIYELEYRKILMQNGYRMG